VVASTGFIFGCRSLLRNLPRFKPHLSLMNYPVNFIISIEYEQAPISRPTIDQIDGSAALCRSIFGRVVLWVLQRWLPGVEIPIIGDQAYNVHKLGGACARKGVRVLAPLQIDPAVYVPAPHASLAQTAGGG
jgi:hypothetical protein